MEDFGLKDLSSALGTLVTAGATARFLYLLIQMSHNPDEADGYKKRMKNTFIFIIASLAISSITNIFVSAYR